MIIYLVRHAESVPRGTKNYEEGYDVPLSAFGRMQARVIARRMKRLGVEKVFASPMMRARETAAAIAQNTGAAVSFDQRLEEYAPSRTLRGKDFKDAKRRAREDWNFVAHDGESVHASAERFWTGVEDAARSGGGSIAIVAHALIIQNALMVRFGMKQPPEIGEASYTAIVFDGGEFRLRDTNISPSLLLSVARKIRKKFKQVEKVWD